jgi:hypothetical protein
LGYSINLRRGERVSRAAGQMATAEEERLAPSDQMATNEEEPVERNLRSGGASGNDDNEEDATAPTPGAWNRRILGDFADDDGNDPFPAHSLPAGPLHSTHLVEAAKEGTMLVRNYEGSKMVGHQQVGPADYDPYRRSYDAREEDKKWRPFRALPPGQDPDPPAYGLKGLYNVGVGCAAFICISVFAFFLIIILFYLEDFGDLDLWMYEDHNTAGKAPPPPVPDL